MPWNALAARPAARTFMGVPTDALTRDLLPPIPLIGRDAEMDGLRACLDDAKSHGPQTIFLAGEIGVGKTRLSHQAEEEARQRGFTVAEGRAFAVESGLPYAIFADALLPLLRRLDAAALTLLTRGAGSDLAGILPGLFAPAAAGDGHSAEESKARTFWSFMELLERLAARQPMLLILDNLQWADASSLELLHFVVRQGTTSAKKPPLLILGTYVDMERDRHAGIRAMEHSLVALGAARVVRLSPLSTEQTAHLVRRLFGVPEGAIHQFAITLHEWTGGNPFFLEETLRSLVERGHIKRVDGTWKGWDVDALTPSRSVRDVVLDRVGRLSDVARSLLDIAAVLGARVILATLRVTSSLSGDELADALDELCRAGVLVEEGGLPVAYDFSHPLVRDIVYTALGGVRAQGMHDRIATTLEALYGRDAATHADELAHHFTSGSLGAVDGRAEAYLAEAGRQALARHADRAALDYLEAALAQGERRATTTTHDVPADAEVSAELLERLARARQRVGDLAGATALWGRLRARARIRGDQPAIAMCELRIGSIASAAGDPALALAHFDAGLEPLSSPSIAPELTTRLRLARATALQAIGRHDAALADASAALEIATQLGDQGLLARVHRALLLLYVWTGPSAKAHEHGERAVSLAAASGERTVAWSAHWAMAIHAGLTGNGAATSLHVREARQLAEEIRSPVLRLWTADIAIEYLAGIGEWREALALADQAIPAARALGQRTLLPRLLVWTGLIHRGLGDLDRARVLIEEAWTLTGAGVAGAAAAGDVHAVVPAYTGMTGYLMTLGDNSKALAMGEAGLAIADRTGYVAWAIYRLLPFVIETALYMEDYERAARHNARLRRDSRALGHALGLAWADTTDALLAYLTGDPARAVPMLRAATAALERVPFVFDAARLRRLVARALFDAGDDDAATSELRKAHEIFARLGAEREMRATREQLRAIGARVPAARRSADGAGVLSGREEEIARLVAARKSNKEIGVTLDISSRTVSTHLSNIFQKLGVGSRGELTDLVRNGGLDGTG